MTSGMVKELKMMNNNSNCYYFEIDNPQPSPN